jgi:DNA repair protein RadD
MKKLWLHQQRAKKQVLRKWSRGIRSVCLVSPPGSGKTVIGAVTSLARGPRVLWIAHRRELVSHAASELIGQLERIAGEGQVGLILGETMEHPERPVQVASIQCLLERGFPPGKFDVVVLDECHHYTAEVWGKACSAYPDARYLGLTATPERQDGSPLGDIFEALVVAAHNSELLRAGLVVPWTVFGPQRDHGHDYAVHPVQAWRDLSSLAFSPATFAYFLRVEIAEQFAEKFRDAGVHAGAIHFKTKIPEREKTMQDLVSHDLQVVTNIYTMTEGVNVPEVSISLVARPFSFLGGYIQATNRAVRAVPGKRGALLIDVCGSSLRHGNPGQDWEYSLKGRAIKRQERPENPDAEDCEENSFQLPVVSGEGLILSECSTYIPQAPAIPRGYLPRPRSAKLAAELKKISGKRGWKVADRLRRVLGGLAD